MVNRSGYTVSHSRSNPIDSAAGRRPVRRGPASDCTIFTMSARIRHVTSGFASIASRHCSMPCAA
jgi:hypothetical protein